MAWCSMQGYPPRRTDGRKKEAGVSIYPLKTHLPLLSIRPHLLKSPPCPHHAIISWKLWVDIKGPNHSRQIIESRLWADCPRNKLFNRLPHETQDSLTPLHLSSTPPLHQNFIPLNQHSTPPRRILSHPISSPLPPHHSPPLSQLHPITAPLHPITVLLHPIIILSHFITAAPHTITAPSHSITATSHPITVPLRHSTSLLHPRNSVLICVKTF